MIYSPMFFCVSPERQAMSPAIKNVATERSLQNQTLAVEAGSFYRGGRPCSRSGGLMISPVSNRVASAFEISGYREEVEGQTRLHDYSFDWDRYKQEQCRIHLRFLDDEPAPECFDKS
jgi:hypothetical protein